MHEVEKKYRILREDKTSVVAWARTILSGVEESMLELIDFRYNIARNIGGADFERLRVETAKGKSIHIYTHKYTLDGLRHEDESCMTYDQAHSAVVGQQGLVLQKLRTQLSGKLDLVGLSVPRMAIDIDEVVGMEGEIFVELEILTADSALIPQLEQYIEQIAKTAPVNLQPESRSMLDMSRPYTINDLEDLLTTIS